MNLFDIKKKRVLIAPLFQRCFSALVDIALVFLVGLGSGTLVSNIVMGIPSVNEYIEAYYDECESSHLLNVNKEAEEVDVNTYSSYEEYNNQFIYFYNTYLPTKETYECVHDNYWYNVHILGLDDTKGIYSEEDLSTRDSFFLTGKDLFEYRTGDYDQIAIPKSFNQDLSTVISQEEQTKLIKFFHLKTSDEETDKTKCVYYFAINEFSLIKDVSENFNAYKLYTYSIPTYGSLFLFSILFYFVIPLILKRGKTLGKLLFGLSVLNADCFECGRFQSAVRMLPLLLATWIIFVIFGFNLLTFGLVTLAVILSFITMVFSNFKQTFHDKFFMTIVIKDKDSVWFKNLNEELEFESKN